MDKRYTSFTLVGIVGKINPSKKCTAFVKFEIKIPLEVCTKVTVKIQNTQ